MATPVVQTDCSIVQWINDTNLSFHSSRIQDIKWVRSLCQNFTTEKIAFLICFIALFLPLCFKLQ